MNTDVEQAVESYVDHYKRGVTSMNLEKIQARAVMRQFWFSFCWFLFGICVGALAMVYVYEAQPKPQPASPVSLEKQLDSKFLVIEQQLAQFKADQEARLTGLAQRSLERAVAMRKLLGTKKNGEVTACGSGQTWGAAFTNPCQ